MDSNLNHPGRLFTSRPYESVQDLQQMLDLLMQARAQTSDWRYAHVGELLFNFFMVACHLNPQEHIRLWFHEQQMVGFAMLAEDPNFDFQVLPAYEWQGIETEAWLWAKNRIAELRKLDEKRWREPCVSGARQDNPQRMAFLEQCGFRQGGQFSEVNMIRSLEEPIPDVEIPAGCQVRSMGGAEDLNNRAEAQRQVWHPWTVGDVSDENYANFMTLPGYDLDLDVVGVAPDGVIASYVNGWIDPVNRIGDLGPLGAREAYRRRGLTRAVLTECLRRMKAQGMNRVCVSTTITNTPARRLYESIGFQIVNQYLEFIHSE